MRRWRRRTGAPHDLSALIADHGAAHIAYFGELTNVSLGNAVRKAATREMNIRWKAFVDWLVGAGEAGIIYKGGKPSAMYTQFFPEGKSEYHEATVAEAQVLAARVKALVAAHSGTLDVDFVATANGLITSYETAREAQMDRKGEATDTRGNRDERKAVLQTRLFQNLLSIALLEMDPERTSLYFTQSLLEDPNRSGEDDEPEEPEEPEV